MIALLNSAVMPAEGRYVLRRVSRDEFARRVADAHRRGELVSFIGYAETAHHVERVAGVHVPVSREQTRLDGPTTLLICKLAYRVSDPASKGKLQPSDEDFEYYTCAYLPL